jgi:hypothetical protein
MTEEVKSVCNDAGGARGIWTQHYTATGKSIFPIWDKLEKI